jgi:hypothetical protein
MESRIPSQRRSLSTNLLPKFSGNGNGIPAHRSNHNLFYGGVGRTSSFPFSHYLSSILKNKETRNVFFFLVLNISFCVVEFLYGFWSNSLGLTSVRRKPRREWPSAEMPSCPINHSKRTLSSIAQDTNPAQLPHSD